LSVQQPEKPEGHAAAVARTLDTQRWTFDVFRQDFFLSHHKIFGVFERLHSETEYPGTGIGLAIVRKAELRMNGALGFESTLGKGSCFWIDLPKA